MTHASISRIPTVLFGAFDRHNFGDLLFPHVVSALLPHQELIFAGLVHRDLCAYGGHQVLALPQITNEINDKPFNILHVGGELLTCNEWQAAIMLLPPTEVQQTIARYDSDSVGKHLWACNYLGFETRAPYCISREMFPSVNKVIYNAIGGVEINACDITMQSEVLSKLSVSDLVSVRDRVTQRHLKSDGINSVLLPDPVVMVAELFKTKIELHAQQDPISQIRNAYPCGYIAVQFSADFGDDETLELIARQLDEVVDKTGFGIAFFRAGAAPWHDDLDCYIRTAERMRKPSKIFHSLNIWDICAFISHAQAYCGSSLHGRIIAMAYALPRVNLIHLHQTNRMVKQAAYAETWEQTDMPVAISVDHICKGIQLALMTNKKVRRQLANELTMSYQQGFRVLADLLT